MDLQGVHDISIKACLCSYAGMLWTQLLDMQLFPASDVLPKTAFTLRLLKHFQMFNLVAKTSLHSYQTAITYLTTPLAPLEHKVRYWILSTRELFMTIG